MAEQEREHRRSRSRVRSHLRNEFRIRDEINGTSKNVMLQEPPTRPHRSLSRLSQGIKRNSSDNQLLQQAIQNHNVRNSEPGIPEKSKGSDPSKESSLLETTARSKSSSGRLLSDPRASKNIPMTNDLPSARPSITRWNSIQYLSNDSLADNIQFKGNRISSRSQNSQYRQPPNRPIDSSSISPLTVIKDEYNTKRPVSNVASTSTDNYYKDLDTPPANNQLDSTRSYDPENGPKTNTTTPTESITHKIYNRMSKLLQRRDDPTLKEIDLIPSNKEALKPEPSIPLSARTSILKFQSELDDESEIEDEPSIAGGDNFDVLSSPNVNQDSSTLDEVNFDKIMNEINDFQHNFVQKFNVNTPDGNNRQTKDQSGNDYDWDSSSSRIQQKILDYKDLYQDENLSKNSSYFSLKLQNQPNYNILNDYTFKIQHETVMQQYNLIRFRYLGSPDFDLYTVNGSAIPKPTSSQNYLKSNMGVLGFLNRTKISENHYLDPRQKHDYRSQRLVPERTWPNTFQYRETPRINPDQYLNDLWHQEMESLFPADADTVVNTPSDTLAPINPSITHKSSFTPTNSVAELAGKVKFNP